MSYFVQFLLILALVVFGCMKTTLQSAMGKRYVRCAQDSVLFNILFFLSISLSVTVLFGIGKITLPLILWAAGVAVFTVMLILSALITRILTLIIMEALVSLLHLKSMAMMQLLK